MMTKTLDRGFIHVRTYGQGYSNTLLLPEKRKAVFQHVLQVNIKSVLGTRMEEDQKQYESNSNTGRKINLFLE